MLAQFYDGDGDKVEFVGGLDHVYVNTMDACVAELSEDQVVELREKLFDWLQEMRNRA